MTNRKTDEVLKVAVIGGPRVDKNSIVNNFVYGTADEPPYNHRLEKEITVEGIKVLVRLYEPANPASRYNLDFDKIRPDVIIVATTLSIHDEFDSYSSSAISQLKHSNAKSVVIVGDFTLNKDDSPNYPGHTEKIDSIQKMQEDNGVPFISINSYTGENVGKAFEIGVRNALINMDKLYKLSKDDHKKISKLISLMRDDKNDVPVFNKVIEAKKEIQINSILSKLTETRVVRAYQNELTNQLRNLQYHNDPLSESQKKAIGGALSKLRARESELNNQLESKKETTNTNQNRGK